MKGDGERGRKREGGRYTVYNALCVGYNYSKHTVYMCMTCAIVHVSGCAVRMYMYMYMYTSQVEQCKEYFK